MLLIRIDKNSANKKFKSKKFYVKDINEDNLIGTAKWDERIAEYKFSINMFYRLSFDELKWITQRIYELNSSHEVIEEREKRPIINAINNR